MRNAIAIVIAAVAAALIGCGLVARRSDRAIAPKVANFLFSLLGPVIGNLLIIIAHTEPLALVGRYLYAAGINIAVYCMLDFTMGSSRLLCRCKTRLVPVSPQARGRPRVSACFRRRMRVRRVARLSDRQRLTHHGAHISAQPPPRYPRR